MCAACLASAQARKRDVSTCPTVPRSQVGGFRSFFGQRSAPADAVATDVADQKDSVAPLALSAEVRPGRVQELEHEQQYMHA